MAYTETQKREHIREIQGYLHALSHVEQDLIHIGADGFYGKETTQAVETFQKKYVLPIMGTVTPETWNAIVYTYRESVADKEAWNRVIRLIAWIDEGIGNSE
ncbi:MAG: peptidoglycan-binding protein [Ruminococcus sp.]|nr:peptidoglycan-binding protein [Ruminococcus sp.]